MKKRSVFLFILLFFIGLGYSQLSVPSLPAVYKGEINSLCEINGFSLIGYIDNEERGRTGIYCDSKACWYGSIKNIYEKDLIIEGYENENKIKNISFNVCGNNRCVKIGEDLFISGNVEILNFSIDEKSCSLLFPSEIEGEPTRMLISSPTTNKTKHLLENETRETFILSLIEKENLYDVLTKDGIALKDILNISVLGEVVVNVMDKRDTKENFENVVNKVKSLISKKKEIRDEEINMGVLTNIAMKIRVIEIIDKEGNKEIYTKIEKKILEDREERIIEVVPKDVASSITEIVMIKGQIIEIIEQDPVFEIKPQDGGFSYVVKGNKTSSALKTITLYYSLDQLEKKERKEEGIYQADKREKREKMFLFVFLIVVLLLVGSLFYLVYSRK